MRRSPGFTLVEMMVVVAIMAILMAAAIPSFMTWLRNVQVRNQAEALLNGIQLARTEALRRNEKVSFWLVSLPSPGVMDNSCTRSDTGTSWVVSRDNPAGLCGTDFSDTTAPRIIQKRAAGDGSRKVAVAATGGGGAGSCITFNGYGRVESNCSDAGAGAPFTLIQITPSEADSNVRRMNIVVSGGIVRMCDPLVSAADDPRNCS